MDLENYDNRDKNLVKDFLNHCFATAGKNQNYLIEVSQNSLNGKKNSYCFFV